MLKLKLLGATALFSLGLALITLTVVGCGGNDAPTEPDTGAATDHDDHDEHAHEGDDHADHDHGDDAHGHDHEMGPNGGHMLHLNPGGAHAEWVHLDQENELQVFLDESLLPVESVAMHVEIGGQEQDPYAFESAEDELGKGAYRLVSDQLMTHVKMSAGEGVAVELVVERDGSTLTASIKHHEH